MFNLFTVLSLITIVHLFSLGDFQQWRGKRHSRVLKVSVENTSRIVTQKSPKLKKKIAEKTGCRTLDML